MLQNIDPDRILDTSSLYLEADLSIAATLEELARGGIKSILVNAQERWFTVSAKTLQLLVEQGRGHLKLADILVIIPPVRQSESLNIWELLRLMRSYRVDCLTVVDQNNQPIGVIMLEEVLQFLDRVARPHLAGGWYDYIADTTAEGIFIVDLDLTLLFVNTKLSNLLGYDTGTMEGRNLNDFLVICDQNDQQVEQERHFRFQALDGTDLWAIVVATPLFDENGYNIGTLGRIGNITEKVTKERKDKRKITALEIAAEGISILNDRGEFIYANPSFCTLMEKTNQELIETDWWSIYGNYRRTPIEVELKQTGKWQGEFCYAGRYIDVSLSTGEEDIICICRDVTDRYQAQQALRESEERYRLLAEYATDVIARCSVQGKYNYVSPACAEVWGYSTDELINHIFFDYIHPEDRVKVLLAYQVMLEKLESNRFVYRFACKDGSYKWMETTARVKRYSDTNAPMEIVTVSREVTESIEAEADLTQSQETLRLALEATNDGLWDWSIVTGCVFYSPRWLEMMGYDRGDLIPHIDSWLELLHPEDRETTLRVMTDHLNNLTPRFEAEFRLLTKNGTYKWLFSKGRVVERDREGNPLRMLGADSDIDQRKRVEEILQKQYRQALILEQITTQIRSSLDVEAVLVATVQELSRHFDQSCALVTFSDHQKIVYPSDDPLSRLEIDLLPPSAWDTDGVTILDSNIMNIDCASDLALVRTSYQDHGKSLILLCSFQRSFLWQPEDIELLEAVAEQVGIAIAQAQLLKESQTQSELARTASRAKGDFLAMMSHEIRTPMNGVIGMAELLLFSGLNDYQKELAQTVLQSSKALLTILNDILDFSKIESGQMTLDLQPYNLSTAMEEILALMTPLCYEKEIELVFDFDLNLPPTIVGDGTRLRQVVVNLLSNAIKFCSRGQVLIRVWAEESQNLLITIEDTGIGIDPTKAGDLFLPFSQLDPSTTRNYGGTGLGLAISKSLVELMGGRIWVESNHHVAGNPPEGWCYQRPDYSGASFYVMIPLVYDTTPDQPVLSPIDRRLLVVEPNDSLRVVLQRWLSAWGLTPEMTTTMSAARSLVKQSNFDAILVDDVLPIEEIMGCVAEVSIPVIVLQQPSSPPLPFVTTLPKPLRPLMFRQLLETLFLPQSVSPPPDPREAIALPQLRVLLVEDNPVNQKVAQRLLLKLGCSPSLAANGIEALALLQSQVYDVVLMDVQMPEMDGLTATQRIRQENSYQPYIIAMTANAMRGDREACLDAGMDDYLSKPISLDSLGQALLKAALR